MWVKWIRLSLPALLMAACAGFPLLGKQSQPDAQAERAGVWKGTANGERRPPQAKLEVHDLQYDGFVLSGRVLISPVESHLRLDRRLYSQVDINIGKVSSCTGEPTTYMMMDFFPSPTAQEDLLVLAPGYWYGGPVRFKLFSERFPGPPCLDAELSLLSFDGEPVASISVRAVRATLPTVDGGISAEHSAPHDAGL